MGMKKPELTFVSEAEEDKGLNARHQVEEAMSKPKLLILPTAL